MANKLHKKELDRLRSIKFMVEFYDFLKDVKKQDIQEPIYYDIRKKNLNFITDILSRQIIQSEGDYYYIEATEKEKLQCYEISDNSFTIYFFPLESHKIEVVLYLEIVDFEDAHCPIDDTISMFVKFNAVPWWAQRWGNNYPDYKVTNDYFLEKFSRVIEPDPDLMIDSPELYEKYYNKIESMMKEMIRQAMGILKSI
jgi:hypothetical protein